MDDNSVPKLIEPLKFENKFKNIAQIITKLK